MSKKLFISLALCLMLFGVANPTLAQTEKTDDDVIAQLEREGWKIATDGVLKRTSADGKVETFFFGVRGFTWKLRDLQSQLQKMRAELRYNPTPELRKAIANHQKAIANTRKIIESARISDANKIDLSKVSCSIDFTHDATAAARTDVQGTKANSSASFTANCGFIGEVYAYAFAKTWLNGAETTETRTDGPRSGSNVSATASATRSGATPCESYAYGTVTLSGNGISMPVSYATHSPSNTSCPAIQPPPPTLNVTVTSNAPSTTIDLYNSDCINITWTTNISGGTPSYTSTMYLNGASQGTRTTYSKNYCNAGTNSSVSAAVTATVTDSGIPVQSKTASAPTITIRSHTVVSAPTPTINGPSYLGVTACTTYTWTASASGGTSPYTYQWTWNGTAVGTASSYSRQYCPGLNHTSIDHTLGLTVTDSASRTGSTSKTVTVERFGEGGGGCGGTPCQ